MQFFNTAFVILASCLILLQLITEGKQKLFLHNISATVNVMLICSTFMLLKYLNGFKQIAEFMGVDVYAVLFNSITWEHIRIVLIIVLPFLFLIKKLVANKFLSILMLFLLLSDIIIKIIAHKASSFNFTLVNFSFVNFHLNFIHYFSWFVVVYAILFFAKKLPSQSINHQS
ncbi:MAG: hypothetical protein KGZ59_05015 [Chitinophagaceae bacterium]|nr:hypothetical protein [Chitinophagaceae bacterium]